MTGLMQLAGQDLVAEHDLIKLVILNNDYIVI